jgi:peptide-methionine (S)-S-oxide reductase
VRIFCLVQYGREPFNQQEASYWQDANRKAFHARFHRLKFIICVQVSSPLWSFNMTIQYQIGQSKWLGIAILGTLLAFAAGSNSEAAVSVPNAKLDAPLASKKSEQVAVFSGGCFWGVEAVFEHVKGVNSAWSGYAGGSATTANYTVVSSGLTGHAESVKVSFDPSKVIYGQLLQVFFSVAHDPTQLNRQGPDSGTQYRSAIFYTNAEQQRIASAYIDQMSAAKVFPGKIVTQVNPLKTFYMAEDYHQDFARLNPRHPYIVYHDLPKVENLKKQFPQWYLAKN